jgi:hypothetical protein
MKSNHTPSTNKIAISEAVRATLTAASSNKPDIQMRLRNGEHVPTEEIKSWVLNAHTDSKAIQALRESITNLCIAPTATAVRDKKTILLNLELNQESKDKHTLQLTKLERDAAYYQLATTTIKEAQTQRRRDQDAKQVIADLSGQIQKILTKIHAATSIGEIEKTLKALETVKIAAQEALYSIDPTARESDAKEAAEAQERQEQFAAAKARKAAKEEGLSEGALAQSPAPAIAPEVAIVAAAVQSVQVPAEEDNAPAATAQEKGKGRAQDDLSDEADLEGEVAAIDRAHSQKEAGPSSPSRTPTRDSGSDYAPSIDPLREENHQALLQEYAAGTYRALTQGYKLNKEDPVKDLLALQRNLTAKEVIGYKKEGLPIFGASLQLTVTPLGNIDPAYWSQMDAIKARLRKILHDDDTKSMVLLPQDSKHSYTLKYEAATSTMVVRFWDSATLFSSPAHGACHLDTCQTLTMNYIDGTVIRMEQETFFRGKGSDFAEYRALLETTVCGAEMLAILSVEELCGVGAFEHACQLQERQKLAQEVMQKHAEMEAKKLIQTYVEEEKDTIALMYERPFNAVEDMHSLRQMVTERTPNNEDLAAWQAQCDKTFDQLFDAVMQASPSARVTNASTAAGASMQRQ